MPSAIEPDPPIATSTRSVVLRRHPCSKDIPYALDLQTTGLHCLPPHLNGPVRSYIPLVALLSRLETCTTPQLIQREKEILRYAFHSSRALGPVYDLPTVPGWALWQKVARLDLFLAAIYNSIGASYRVPPALRTFDDIKPDVAAHPEVSTYTEIAAVLYEALDCLLFRTATTHDIHLRNLYPHAVWSSGLVISQGQGRCLAAVAPPPRSFSRWLECPTVGEILAAPGRVRRPGWITFFEALVPTHYEGGVTFGTPGLQRFVPRSTMLEKPAPASLILEDLTFAELYYLVMIEQIATQGELRAVYHGEHVFENMSLGLVDEWADRIPFCQARGVHIESVIEDVSCHLDALAKQSRDSNRALAYAEQAMCNFISNAEDDSSFAEDPSMTFIYKRDARVDAITLDGYDGWTDEELNVKKHKAWVAYCPNLLTPSEIAALYRSRGIRFYSAAGQMTILREDVAVAAGKDMDGALDCSFPDDVTWSDLKLVLQACGPGLEHSADRLLLALLVAGEVRISGYYHCFDASGMRHLTRSTCVFMDLPLQVLAYKLPEKKISFLDSSEECLLIPVGPACTIMMRNIREKYSLAHGRVHHSDKVTVLPHACRLGDRRQLKWYAVGAGFLKATINPPKTLIQMTEKQLSELSCTASAERDHILISARKGLASVRLKSIGFEAGWSGLSPHLLITGKGKRITTSVRAHSVTHLVEVLRKIRDKNNNISLTHSIQEIAALVIMKEVLIGSLYITRQQCNLEWAPDWKLADEAFVISHAISLPRGVAARSHSDVARTTGILLTEDTMAVMKEGGASDGIWNLIFVRLDANIESEKLLVGPSFEGFSEEVDAGKMGSVVETETGTS